MLKLALKSIVVHYQFDSMICLYIIGMTQ